MEWLWLIPLNVALLLVPAMFGVWAWAEVIERIREDHAAVGRRTRALRSALVATSATYLVGAGTWVHPAMIEFILATTLPQRALLYSLIAVPWIAFGTIGLIARSGRRTGLRGFLEEKSRQERRLGEAHARSRAFLHAIGIELETALHQIQERVDQIERASPRASSEVTPVDTPTAGAVSQLRNLAAALRVPVPSEPTTVILDDCLRDGLEGVRAVAEERRVSVFRSGLEGCAVLAGPERLRQILATLLEGAMERAPREEGMVVIGVHEAHDPPTIQLTINDNGKTLSDAHLARAFALDGEATADAGPAPGLGYPLAVARRLARQDDGDVHIAPAASGGTTTTLILKRATEDRTARDGGDAVHAT